MEHEIVVGEQYYCDTNGWRIDGSMIEVTHITPGKIFFTMINPSNKALRNNEGVGYEGTISNTSSAREQLKLIGKPDLVEEEVIISPGFDALFDTLFGGN